MRRNRPWIAYGIFTLIAVGIISTLFDNPGTMLIPLIVFGVVFYLYKFPPGRSRPVSKSKSKTTGRKYTFRVIRGNKRDDDEPPRYH